MILQQDIFECDVISRIIYISKKRQYLKNEGWYRRAVNAIFNISKSRGDERVSPELNVTLHEHFKEYNR